VRAIGFPASEFALTARSFLALAAAAIGDLCRSASDYGEAPGSAVDPVHCRAPDRPPSPYPPQKPATEQ
jgi:hypothetical protein